MLKVASHNHNMISTTISSPRNSISNKVHKIKYHEAFSLTFTPPSETLFDRSL